MAVTIHVNGKSNSLAHKGGMGFTKSTLPDVCKTPSPGGPVPIPYPIIISMSNSLKKGSKKVKVDGGNSAAIKGSEFSRCNGDEPGTVGGIKSSTNMKEATWILYSFDVKIEGKNACRLTDKMMMNHGNTACLSGHFTKPVFADLALSKLWDDCKDQHDKYKDTQEESADLVDRELHLRVHAGGSLQDRVDFVDRLEKRIKVTKRLHKERKKYIDMDCDQFDWGNPNRTQAERVASHSVELDNVSNSLKNLYDLLGKFKL